ncbi:heterodimeric geranylgeranyl pyrophosphate synthase small subunit, chloroplastic-like [Rhododendron vialii]|uniref:heterodimeric geranylgeranyl pyrophosphate synthase small subunit, chloroplastic-like n=1 Tax=Rhododendron vialii TaxID=182163 RepID=UPI00265E00CE|nr:heterodimeric geranylgeranyl pyrophosphate synthase small subunit, chloroplastic-like [Rhododendron vialii]
MARALSHYNGKSSFLSLSRSNPCHPSPSPFFTFKPMMVTMAHNSQSSSYWASIEEEIEDHLKQAIPVRPPTAVFEPMNCLVFAAPKTKAPALCVASCELVGGRRAEAMDAASALHLMHSAAYTHENLPLTDRPDAKPMIHHAYNPNIELLTGDGIVPFGFELLARDVGPAQNNLDQVLRVIVEITRAIGSRGIVHGQYNEIQGTQSDDGELCNDEWIEYVCKKKEGELHACGAACGAILGGGSEDEIEGLRKYGLYVGMIYGILNGVGRKEKGLVEVVEKLRALALEELESFKGSSNVESISSLVEVNIFNV